MKYKDFSKMSSQEEVWEYLKTLNPNEVQDAFQYQYVYKKQKAIEILKNSDSPEECLYLLGNENYMDFFLEFKKDFIQRDIYEFGLFTTMVNMNMNLISSVHSAKVVLDLLRDADQKKLQDCGDKLPITGSIEVFRGIINDKDNSSIHRCSWTLNKNIAAWFAVKCSRNDRGTDDKPAVYKRIAPPEAIFYYTNDEGEQEVVLDPEKCEPATKLSHMPEPIKQPVETTY